ncbi:putative Histidinol dehydrogenase [Rhodotorula taiwanensis]|uniref:Putative Histidinol dehydrogenase n=1 Tax=Rhodotorula taiwanensis TaxID=741276 RepID=A0A2S5B702_9BASI|nr:putative Histidinol dehydrogenase [Rhodotorula taiwanensis]
MSISQLAFLPLLDSEPSSLATETLPALARIAPLLVPSSLAASALTQLPPTADHYILDDTDLSLDEAIRYLDKGARRIASRNKTFLASVPAERFILRCSRDDLSLLSNAQVVSSISGVLYEVSEPNADELAQVRTALKAVSGRPRDLFLIPDSLDAALRLPVSLKSLGKSAVSSIAVVPTSYMSTEMPSDFASPSLLPDKLPIASLFTSCLRSDRTDGLFVTIPVSLSSVTTPLGLVYSSAESIAHSILSGNAVYYSRSRNGLWRKGETSGAMQRVERIRFDCDADALEFGVVECGPQGEKEGFCHVPEQTSCFGGVGGLAELEATLKKRMAEAPAGSYTKRLFDEPLLLRAKIMEEAGEVCDATTAEELASEVADLLYFTMTRAVANGVSLKDVQAVLDKRSLKVTRRKGDAKPEWVEKLGLGVDQAKGVDGAK